MKAIDIKKTSAMVVMVLISAITLMSCRKDHFVAVTFPEEQQTALKPSSDGENTTVEFTSISDWEAIVTAVPNMKSTLEDVTSWCTISTIKEGEGVAQVAGDAGEMQFFVITTPNETDKDRVAIITIKSSGGDRTVTVEQKKLAALVTLNEKQATDFAMPEGGEERVKFTSAKRWTTTITGENTSWCTIAPGRGDLGDGEITITAPKNTTIADRIAIVTINSDEIKREITINQKGVIATLFVNNVAATKAGNTAGINLLNTLETLSITLTLDVATSSLVDWSATIISDKIDGITTTGDKMVTMPITSGTVNESDTNVIVNVPTFTSNVDSRVAVIKFESVDLQQHILVTINQDGIHVSEVHIKIEGNCVYKLGEGKYGIFDIIDDDYWIAVADRNCGVTATGDSDYSADWYGEYYARTDINQSSFTMGSYYACANFKDKNGVGGWRLPTMAEWIVVSGEGGQFHKNDDNRKLKREGETWKLYDEREGEGENFVYFPMSGHEEIVGNDTVVVTGEEAYYLIDAPYGEQNAWAIYFDDIGCSSMMYRPNMSGNPIRCVKTV